VNRVRIIVRACLCGRKAAGIDECYGSTRARDSGLGCPWRASLMHPLDEPDGLQKLAQSDLPVRDFADQ
jgi:hypothetical protein